MLTTVTAVGVVVGLVAQGGPAAADVDRVSGSAAALIIGGGPTGTATGSAAEAAGTDGFGPVGSGILPSGTLCPSGSTVPPVSLPVVLSVGLLDACTRGGGVSGENHLGFAESSAAVANVVIAAQLLGVVRSACRADGDGASGNSQIIGSGIPGIPENPPPNFVPQISPIPGLLSLILNEQIVLNTPGTATITVNAVHLNLLGIDIILGQSSCQAFGPNVNSTTTTSTTTTSTVPPTTAPPTTVPPTTAPPTTVPPTTVPPTTTPPTTSPFAGGGGPINNNNTNNNTSNNVNNNQNTVTVGGDTINISTPPALVTFLPGAGGGGGGGQSQTQSQDQSQQQGQQLKIASTPGGILARTGSSLTPLAVLAALALVLGNLIRIGSRGVATEGAPSHLARRYPRVGSVPLEWGPAQIGRAMLAALVTLVAGVLRLFSRRR
ncbi:MAG: hypothetical protein M3314_12100 [Actinomycetota bacterium]|nr:hypothetical protein [Actinomycetota bacterium]